MPRRGQRTSSAPPATWRTPPMSSPIVLSLCDLTGTMLQPWLDDGYECWQVDLQHEPGVRTAKVSNGLLVTVGADLTDWLPPRRDYAFVAAFPPCTNLAVSGARWFQDKGLAGLADGLRLVERCADIAAWSDAPWMLENPVSTISSYWRKPDHMFDPYEYAGYPGGEDDGYTKRTCLWTGNGFVMPPAKPGLLAENHDRIHKAAPGPERANFRSATPAGFAHATWETNRAETHNT